MRSISLPYERADTSPQQRATDPEQGNGFGAGILTEVGADGIREDAPEHADAQPDSATDERSLFGAPGARHGRREGRLGRQRRAPKQHGGRVGRRSERFET